MRVLLVHNYYQHPGGEDQVFADEAALLESHGHEVIQYTLHNDAIKRLSRMQMVGRTLWNARAYSELRALIRAERPVLMHCANTFPLISPAAYSAADEDDVAVVQTLHNYRLLCPNALFLRDGRVCEDCLGKLVPWPGIQHGCYRNSRSATAVVAGMLTGHRLAGTWTRKVDRYIATTDFARRKFIEGGFPADKVAVKSNFVSLDTGPGDGDAGYAVYVGRLSTEKGINTLLAAWASWLPAVPLKIVGDGPLADQVRLATVERPTVEWLGQRSFHEVQSIIGHALCLVAPSISYEGALPRTILEAFCKGTPVITTRLGAMADLVEHGSTGMLCEPGDSAALAQSVATLAANPGKAIGMRENARAVYEARYTANHNYRQLMAIYADALRMRGRQSDATQCDSAVAPAMSLHEQAALTTNT